MHAHIKKLYQIANKLERLIIGIMSGTSLDGLDIALCLISGHGKNTSVNLINFTTIEYGKNFRDEIKSVSSKNQVDLQKVCVLNPWVATIHGEMINECLSKWNINPENVDLIASHGQTIYHAPKHFHQLTGYPNATLQIGDGDHLAYTTGIITCSDFRQKHIAAGGEGAPLAAYGDYLLFSSESENRIMLNIGGIANITVLPKLSDMGNVHTSDVGPGNTMMDAFIQFHYPRLHFDKNANLAMQGNTNNDLLLALKSDPFFILDMPKTIGPELFNLEYLSNAQVKSSTTNISEADIMATLNKLSADVIVEAIIMSVQNVSDYSVYCSGGGIYNPLLLKSIRGNLAGKDILLTDSLGIDPSAKEAILFAILANECVAGKNSYSYDANNRIPLVTMGKISFYD